MPWGPVVAALLVAGCATSAPPSPSPGSGAADEPRPIAWYQRCSPADPDRYAWFCVIGQIAYSILGGSLPPASPGLK
jgi:hypothetical protein